MVVLIRTSDVPPADRYDAWRSIVCDTLGPVSSRRRIMLLAEPTFAKYATKTVADATASTEAILVLGVESPDRVDELVDKALATGAVAAGIPQHGGGRYQRGFADLDGHHWEALCLVEQPS